MSRNRIIKDELDDWASKRFEAYASETIQIGTCRKRLRFETSINGKMFRVSLGGKLIYEGPAFHKSAHAYHTAG